MSPRVYRSSPPPRVIYESTLTGLVRSLADQPCQPPPPPPPPPMVYTSHLHTLTGDPSIHIMSGEPFSRHTEDDRRPGRLTTVLPPPPPGPALSNHLVAPNAKGRRAQRRKRKS
ncbi:hypothetical protein CGRA01v4_07496 [Colletotrichum graminicola]|nr:hypothetical protein CGRA01v4_07496 [Colletotrichum graminicola]